ncbi:hypothetical protein ACOYR1_11880 [Thalassotalea piscium]
MDKLRRQFLFNLPEKFKHAQDSSETFDADSFEAWQPLLASAKPFLDDEVKRLGLSTEGKSEIDLLKEIFSYQDKPI